MARGGHDTDMLAVPEGVSRSARPLAGTTSIVLQLLSGMGELAIGIGSALKPDEFRAVLQGTKIVTSPAVA
ncbi:hypothetical protein SLH49_08835 [Cognatiyoonia sp. IB215446]|uniref:hypothetical protein n=1 Tax=Cognatiyoonia sp. IB215446 TaxID=3097355 RepID=UPI002A0B18DC|nr:hypothetical protein [Cognatiyoonia sp. IB215446]MDX8348090.1 hypothetical protein [Cognatiyoonia sp. IB215446]